MLAQRSGDGQRLAGGGLRCYLGLRPAKPITTEVSPMPHRNAEVRMLDHGYVREARSLLYHAYRHDLSLIHI